MDSQQQRSSLIQPKTPRRPTADPQDLIQTEPDSLPARQRLYSLLADQRRAIDQTAHFKMARHIDLSSNNFEAFLSDRLFETKRPLTRHRRAETNLLGNHSVKMPRMAGDSPQSASHCPSPAQGLHPDLKKELRHKTMASLQSFLAKSYQSYRSNFLATTDKQPAPATTPSFPSPPKPLSARPRLPSPPTKPPKDLESPACTFVNFYSTKPTPSSLGDVDEKLGVKVRRYFKVSVEDGVTKEGKPSASTQCSGSSHLGWN